MDFRKLKRELAATSSVHTKQVPTDPYIPTWNQALTHLDSSFTAAARDYLYENELDDAIYDIEKNTGAAELDVLKTENEELKSTIEDLKEKIKELHKYIENTLDVIIDKMQE